MQSRRHLFHSTLAALLLASLAGCAFKRIDGATAQQASTAQAVVIEGRINYFVDGENKAPYGSAKPKWPTPRFSAVELQTAQTYISPEVEAADGRFRWALPPGAYLMTRIGSGSFGDDTLLAWPGVLLCIPRVEGGSAVHVGHLKLMGRSYDELVTLSTGTQYRARGVRWQQVVEAEGLAGAPQALMQVRPDLPAGDSLVAALEQRRAALVQRACA